MIRLWLIIIGFMSLAGHLYFNGSNCIDPFLPDVFDPLINEQSPVRK